MLALAIYFNDVAAAVEELVAFMAVHLAFEAATARAIGRTRASMVTAAGGIFMLIVLCVAAAAAHRILLVRSFTGRA